MARYTCSYIVKTSLKELETLLKDMLKTCEFEVMYHTPDYMMAREIPGKVPFSKLVTVEALIDSTTATKNEVQVSLVVKNDELPLQLDNHCRQLFEGEQGVITKDYQWQLVESVPG